MDHDPIYQIKYIGKRIKKKLNENRASREGDIMSLQQKINTFIQSPNKLNLDLSVARGVHLVGELENQYGKLINAVNQYRGDSNQVPREIPFNNDIIHNMICRQVNFSHITTNINIDIYNKLLEDKTGDIIEEINKPDYSGADNSKKINIEFRKTRFLMSLQYFIRLIQNRKEGDFLECANALTKIQGLISTVDDLELYVSTGETSREKTEATYELVKYFRPAINELAAEIIETGPTNEALNHFNDQATLKLSEAEEKFSPHRHSQKCRTARKRAIIIIGIISIVGIVPLACIMLFRRRALFTTTTRTSQLCDKIGANIKKLCKRDQKCSVSRLFANNNKIAHPEKQKRPDKNEAVFMHKPTSQYHRLHN